jgi:hypothetical protein
MKKTAKLEMAYGSKHKDDFKLERILFFLFIHPFALFRGKGTALHDHQTCPFASTPHRQRFGGFDFSSSGSSRRSISPSRRHHHHHHHRSTPLYYVTACLTEHPLLRVLLGICFAHLEIE